MMSRHFRLSSELTGAIAKRPPHGKNQPSAPGSFFNQFVTDIYIYIYTAGQKELLKCLPKIRLIFTMIARPSSLSLDC